MDCAFTSSSQRNPDSCHDPARKRPHVADRYAALQSLPGDQAVASRPGDPICLDRCSVSERRMWALGGVEGHAFADACPATDPVSKAWRWAHAVFTNRYGPSITTLSIQHPRPLIHEPAVARAEPARRPILARQGMPRRMGLQVVSTARKGVAQRCPARGRCKVFFRARDHHVLERIRYSRCSGEQRPARMQADSAGTSLRSFAARWQKCGLLGLPRWRRGRRLNFSLQRRWRAQGAAPCRKTRRQIADETSSDCSHIDVFLGSAHQENRGLARKRSRSRQNTAVNHGPVGFCHRQTINSPRFLC